MAGCQPQAAPLLPASGVPGAVAGAGSRAGAHPSMCRARRVDQQSARAAGAPGTAAAPALAAPHRGGSTRVRVTAALHPFGCRLRGRVTIKPPNYNHTYLSVTRGVAWKCLLSAWHAGWTGAPHTNSKRRLWLEAPLAADPGGPECVGASRVSGAGCGSGAWFRSRCRRDGYWAKPAVLWRTRRRHAC